MAKADNSTAFTLLCVALGLQGHRTWGVGAWWIEMFKGVRLQGHDFRPSATLRC